ncbi:MAG: prepilin peptidase [Patescibacteria group bacterium]|nr:prepilin peptidase [Patescibacteria group bacterium]
MNFFSYLIIFLFGLIMGSFLNAIIYRLRSKENILLERSHCPYCGHKLNWNDLIPIISFFLLKGKCRYCKKPISWQYPLVEIATGLTFLLVFNFFTRLDIFLPDGAGISVFNFQTTLIFSFLFLISCSLIIIFVYDLKYYLIPDEIIYPSIIFVFLYQIIFNFHLLNISYLILSGLGAAMFFLIIFLISRGKWMGFGDVKLAFFMGVLLGFPKILIALFMAFFLGAIIGIGLIMLSKKTLKSEVPFGPFLITGTFIALFWGEYIFNWYFNLI